MTARPTTSGETIGGAAVQWSRSCSVEKPAAVIEAIVSRLPDLMRHF